MSDDATPAADEGANDVTGEETKSEDPPIDRRTAPMGPYTTRQVLLGLVVLGIGVVLTVVLSLTAV